MHTSGAVAIRELRQQRLLAEGRAGGSFGWHWSEGGELFLWTTPDGIFHRLQLNPRGNIAWWSTWTTVPLATGPVALDPVHN